MTTTTSTTMARTTTKRRRRRQLVLNDDYNDAEDDGDGDGHDNDGNGNNVDNFNGDDDDHGNHFRLGISRRELNISSSNLGCLQRLSDLLPSFSQVFQYVKRLECQKIPQP